MGIRYKWGPGGHGVGEPEIFAREVEVARKRFGQVTALGVVEIARPSDSPIHHYFEWRDEVAGELYRADQARKYLRCLVVIRDDGGQVKERAFYAITARPRTQNRSAPRLRNYERAETVLNDPTMREEVLRDTLRSLRAFSAKYRHLVELTAVWQAIDEAAEQIELTEALEEGTPPMVAV